MNKDVEQLREQAISVARNALAEAKDAYERHDARIQLARAERALAALRETENGQT